MQKLSLILLIHSFSLMGYSQPAREKLVVYWSFDQDTDSSILDGAANLLHGTAYDIEYSDAVSGRYIEFRTTTNEIRFPSKEGKAPAEIAGLSKGSISVWFKYKSLPEGQMLPILYFGERDTGTEHNSLIIEIGHGLNPDNRKLYFTIINTRFCFDSGENLEEERWYHFVAVVNETWNTGYLDGEPIVNRHYNLGSDSTYADFFADVPQAEVLAIGYGRYGQEDPFFHYQGSVDEVAIYGKAKILGTPTLSPSIHDQQVVMTVYPNPATDKLHIHSGIKIDEVKILDITGKTIHMAYPNSRECMLNVSKLPGGIYFVSIDTGTVTRFFKR